MLSLSDEIRMRINTRKMGQETLGIKYEIDSAAEELEQLLIQAESKSYQDGYWDIYSCRKILGPAIIFLKKSVRKLLKIFLGWYIFPIYQKQSDFNKLALTILRRQNKTILLMQGHIEMLERQNNCINLEEK